MEPTIITGFDLGAPEGDSMAVAIRTGDGYGLVQVVGRQTYDEMRALLEEAGSILRQEVTAELTGVPNKAALAQGPQLTGAQWKRERMARGRR